MNPADPQSGQRLDALVACLEEEFAALLAEDAARLQSVLARKQQLLESLAANAVAPGNRRAGATALTRALARVQELNRRNAAALAPRQAANRARLRFLQSALGQANVYAADGMLAGAAPAGGGRPRGSA